MQESVIIHNVTPEKFREIIQEAVKVELKSQPAKEESRYLTRKETAEVLHISLPTLNEYSKRGILKSHRVGSRVLYLESQVLTAIK